MSFVQFFQENIIFFIAGIAILGYLCYLEITGAKNRGTVLTTGQFTQKINQGAILIDLRGVNDFKKAHIAGAKHFDKDDLSNHYESFKKEKAIAIYCHTGILSGKAVSELKKAGFDEVYHLEGGIAAWQRENLPTTN